MSTQNTASVQKHRARMKANGCRRLEVTIGTGMIDRAREIARLTGWPLWHVIEEALDSYVVTDHATTGNGK